MLNSKKFHYPWAKGSARLRKKAKQEGWSSVHYYDNGYRFGYLKARGPKWSQVVILAWRKNWTPLREKPYPSTRVNMVQPSSAF